MKNTIQKFMHDLDLQRVLHNAGIEPARIFDIDVKDAEIVQPDNVNKFYDWLVKCGNIHLNDNNQVTNAFNKIN